MELATEMVGGLRRERGDDSLCTSRIADTVRCTLIARGYSLAALLFVEFRSRTGSTASFDVDRVTPFWSDERLFGTN